MKRFAVITIVFGLASSALASWYWPFGSDSAEETTVPVRISELMEPASLLIDEAADLAAEGQAEASIEKYRQALLELDRIELENPERIEKPEFASLRTKRAYVNAAIDGMLLRQVRENARAVSVSDTQELERKLAEERWSEHVEKAGKALARKDTVEAKAELEAAFRCNTNAFLRAGVCNVRAAAGLLSGDFEEASRALAHAEARLRGYEAKDPFLAQSLTNSLSGIQGLLTDYGEIVATAEVVRAGGTVASNCIQNLDFLMSRLEQYDFVEADGLYAAAAKLREEWAATLKSEKGGAPRSVTVAGFSAATFEFRGLSPKMAGVRDDLARVENLVLGAKRIVRKRQTEAEPVVVRQAEAALPTPPPAPESAGKLPASKREQAIDAIGRGDYATAEKLISQMLEEKPNGAMALNLKASMESKRGNLKAAEEALDRAIMSNPRNYCAYYNMAYLLLEKNPGNKESAKRYYETGRAMNGPENPDLEEALK